MRNVQMKELAAVVNHSEAQRNSQVRYPLQVLCRPSDDVHILSKWNDIITAI